MPQCAMCSSSFNILPDEEAFLEKLTFTFGDVKINPAAPVNCPDCRLMVRTCHRNEQNLYKNKSALSGKDIVSLYDETPPWGEPYKIYAQEEWKNDAFDPLQYGRAYEFNRSFFDQYAELQKAVPRVALVTMSNENSDYTTGTGFCKNCYLINSSEYCEDCYYGKLLQKCKNSCDCSYLYDSELCYQCFSVYNSYNCTYLAFGQNCQDCHFSSNLQSCKNCCLCTNLSRKEYHFLNEPLSKEEYAKRLKEFQGSYARQQEMKKVFADMNRKKVHKYANIVNCENCSGDYIENSKNCLDCYDVNDSQDCRYVTVGVNVKDNYDCSNMYIKPELCYDTLGTIEAYGSAYCLFIFNSQRMLYCDTCYSCSDCFGCIGLTRKSFCIFNKQYTKDEYNSLVPRIIERMRVTKEWGLYFLPRISTFAFNETLAYEYFPLTKEEATKRGFHWKDKNDRDYRPQTYVVPDSIKDVSDDIMKQILACDRCGKNYKIIPQELAFYRQHILPIPHQCPDCRHRERMQLRNPRKLWKRNCAKCKKEVQTTYSPERPETIYCDDCYRQEVY